MLKEYLEVTTDSLIKDLVDDITDEILVIFAQGEPFDIVASEIEDSVEITAERIIREWVQKGLALTLTV